MFLTDWPLHLFPEVTLVTIYRHFFFLFFGKCRLKVDMSFPTVVTTANIVVCPSNLCNIFFITYLFPPACNN